MISSTCYDLRQVRDDLRRFVEDLGYRALISEHPSFPIDPDATTVENCRRRVEQDADILVLIIGTRYGSIEAQSGKSVTNLEYSTARHKHIPIYAFVAPSILTLLPLWLDDPTRGFAGQIDNPRIFEFVEQVRTADQVWMQPFDCANDIIEALRTQFAYQQFRGLALQQRLRDGSDREWLDLLRGKTLRIALDRPDYWEYRLFAAALADAVAKHRTLKRRHRLVLALGAGEDVSNPLAWISSRFNDARRLVENVNAIFDQAIPEGLGPRGVPGDPELLVFAADAVGEIYRDALLWASRVRSANVPSGFERLLETIAPMLDDTLEKIEVFGPQLLTSLEEALQAPLTDSPREVVVTLTLTIHPGSLQAYTTEIERLRRLGPLGE